VRPGRGYMKILEIAVKKEEIPVVLEKYFRSENVVAKDMFPCLAPVSYFEIETRIKRAFGLEPRIITQRFFVNMTTGEIFRVPSRPETADAAPSGEFMAPALVAENRVEKQVLQLSMRHVTRYYKFFWRPEAVVTAREEMHILLWAVEMEHPAKPSSLFINAYSGQVSKVPVNLLSEVAAG